MELGQLRCDVNVSVELDGKEGTRVEIKNLNSIRAIRQALSYEYNRHVDAYKRGEIIPQETLAFDEKTNQTRPMRTKQTSEDYSISLNQTCHHWCSPVIFLKKQTSTRVAS